jgi:hypothetical protein
VAGTSSYSTVGISTYSLHRFLAWFGSLDAGTSDAGTSDAGLCSKFQLLWWKTDAFRVNLLKKSLIEVLLTKILAKHTTIVEILSKSCKNRKS